MFFDQYIFGGVIASLLAVAFLWTLRSTKKREDKYSQEDDVSGVTTTSPVGECRSDVTDSDVIIVGAGVAGAALAHTLGKVILIFELSLFL